MCFLRWGLIAFLLMMVVFEKSESANLLINENAFEFQDINQCSSNEFYDLDYFKCLPCGEMHSNLQQTYDKFGCQCKPNTVELAQYDTFSRNPICVDNCLNKNSTRNNNTLLNIEQNQNINNNSEKCLPVTNFTKLSVMNCKYKYINTSTINQQQSPAQLGNFKHLRITQYNPDENCTICNIQYNSLYLNDLCIFRPLLKPYVNYNDFWHQTNAYENLKFVAFLCLSLQNATACNNLANLCIISFYSFDKNSPCGPFLLAQATDSLLRYAHLDEHLKELRPLLFYKKGKVTKGIITEPINGIKPCNNRGFSEHDHLKFFTTVYTTDGLLHRWGAFHSGNINLCRLYNYHNSKEYSFDGNDFTQQSCQLSLENIIDLTKLYGNKYFFSIYLNFTSDDNPDKMYVQNVPILIENLSPENQNTDIEDWQLVRRFQLFEYHTRFKTSSMRKIPIYRDEHKLLFYRMIRYVDKFEIHLTKLDGDRITIPVIKLHYRSIEISENSSLYSDIYQFSYRVNVTTAPITPSKGIDSISDGIIFGILLLFALCIASLRTYNFVRQRRQQLSSSLPSNSEFCGFGCFTKFALSFISNVANAILIFFVICIGREVFHYVTEYNGKKVLPPFNTDMTALIFIALVLKLAYLSVYFWHIGHVHIFFIDWERRKSCDVNYFTLRSHTETASECSNIRTGVTFENNVSAWRTFYVANEWISLSGKQKTSNFIQCIFSFLLFTIIIESSHRLNSSSLTLFILVGSYAGIFSLQIFLQYLFNWMFGHPLQKFVDSCSFANISLFILSDSNYGFYIHGRSPHGFADTDLSTILLQLRRESQNMCGKPGLLNDTYQQTYVIYPPTNLRTYCENILIPLQKSYKMPATRLRIDSMNFNEKFEKLSMAHSSINRFFCAFIDHAVREMDYIIKDKTLSEKILGKEFDNFLNNTNGIFYTDTNFSFGQLFLYGNTMELFLMQLLVLCFTYIVIKNAAVSIIVVCSLSKLFQRTFPLWTRQNIATKTLIDKRFLN